MSECDRMVGFCWPYKLFMVRLDVAVVVFDVGNSWAMVGWLAFVNGMRVVVFVLLFALMKAVDAVKLVIVLRVASFDEPPLLLLLLLVLFSPMNERGDRDLMFVVA